MEEKQKQKSGLSISKEKGYKDLKIVLNGIDSKRAKEFNLMKTIEVSKDELLKIGKHRWLQSI